MEISRHQIPKETKQSRLLATLRQKGAEVNISWTPGHTSIVGNEIADALVKEAATEARNQPECSRSTTIQEIKEANKKSQLSKWQSRWDKTEYGRAYHMLVSNVDTKIFWIFPTGRASVKSFKYRQDIQNSMTTEINWANATVISAPATNRDTRTLPHPLSQLHTLQKKLCS